MRYYLLFILSLCLTWTYGQDIAPTEVNIDTDQLKHPYLLFDEEEKAEILQRINTDPESKAIWAHLLAEADMLLYQPVESEIPPRPTHVRAGWNERDRKNAYQRKLGRYRDYAEILAFVYQLSGKEAYAQKAYAFAEVICNMPRWIHQAHEFDIIYSRVWPWNVAEDQVNFNFDIGSATVGQALAWVYDWTYPALSKPQKDKLRGALLEKVITPVRGDYDLHWWASSYRCNWTGVCNGGIGMVALALLKDHPQLTDVVAESHNRINRMMNELGQDGGWQEGGGYWRYGMDRSTLFAYALKRLSQHNLFLNPKVKANPVTFPVYLFVPPNRAVNFGDSGDKRIGGTDFFNLLVTETQSPEGAWYRQYALGEGRNLLDLIFPRPTIEPKMPANPSRHFRTIDWWVMRSDFTDPDKVTLAGKAGLNDDPHHGHLDIGHFILFWQGEDYLKDSGRPYYDEEYFDEARWRYPQAASIGHNTVLVNGEQQISGKLKDQPFNYEIGGKVLAFETSEQRDYVLMDPSNAYPGKELKRWRRHITLEKPHISLVLDEVVAASPKAKVQVRYHSGANVKLHENLVMLNGTQGKMAVIPLSNQTLQLQAGRHAYQPVHGTKPFEWLPYFDISYTAQQAASSVATLIVPVEDLAEAQRIQASLQWQENGKQLSLSVRYKTQTYTYGFTKDNQGQWEKDK